MMMTLTHRHKWPPGQLMNRVVSWWIDLKSRCALYSLFMRDRQLTIHYSWEIASWLFTIHHEWWIAQFILMIMNIIHRQPRSIDAISTVWTVNVEVSRHSSQWRRATEYSWIYSCIHERLAGEYSLFMRERWLTIHYSWENVSSVFIFNSFYSSTALVVLDNGASGYSTPTNSELLRTQA